MKSYTKHGEKYDCTGHSIGERHSAVDDFFLELRQDTHAFAALFLSFLKKSDTGGTFNPLLSIQSMLDRVPEDSRQNLYLQQQYASVFSLMEKFLSFTFVSITLHHQAVSNIISIVYCI